MADDEATGSSERQPFSSPVASNYERYFVPTVAVPFSGGLLGAAALSPGERVLDLACGTGVIARLAADQVGTEGTVTGIDLEPDMVAAARAAEAPSKGVGIGWHVGDAASLPFEDDTFDVVLCQMAIMLMADRAVAMSEIRRVLVPGGRTVMSTPGPMQAPFAALERVLADNIGAEAGEFVRTVFSMHDPDAFYALLRGAGLRGATVQTMPVRLELPGPAEFLWQYIFATPLQSLVARAPERTKEAMERQAVEAWGPYVVGGTIRFEQPALLASAVK